MGLLDDAIREHLELKRRSGADPSEVARMEKDALGPAVPQELDEVAAGVANGEPAAEVPEVQAEEQQVPAVEEYAPPEYEGPPADYVDTGHGYEDGAGEYEQPYAAEPHPEQQQLVSAPEEDVTAQETQEYDAATAAAAVAAEPERAAPPLAEPEPEAAPEPVPEPEHAPTPAAEEEHAESEEHEGEEPEDVLEKTPDFLQETPEHDRLWFEQTPPQDFDFDK